MKLSLSNKILALFLLVVGIEFFIYSYNPVLRGDEAAYCYVLDWEHNGWANGYGISDDFPKIETVGDVVRSQYDHYMHWGGRNLVHAVEQFFSGVSSPIVFYVINTFVFLATISLIVYIGVGRKKMGALSPWLITVIGVVYLLPWSLYILTSINMSCNYLWPMFGLLLVYAMWRYVRIHSLKLKIWQCVVVAILAFVAGWSHEAYSLALSGAFFFYYIFHIKELRGAQAWIVIAYWIGTLIMATAPGNLFRFTQAGHGSGLMHLVKEFVMALPRLKCVYIFLIALLYFRIKRRDDYRRFVADNRVLITMWILAFVFICFIHTVSQSFTGIEMMSILLFICLCKPLFTGKRNKLVAVLMLIVCVHLGFISAYEFRQNKSEREAVERYTTSEDGLAVNYTRKCTNPLISPWLRAPMDNFRMYPQMQRIYADNPHDLILVTPEDVKIIENPEAYFVEKYRFGSGPFYAVEGCSKAWAPADSSLLDYSYLLHFDKPKWNEQMSMADRIKSIIKPDAVSRRMPAEAPMIIDTRYGKFTILQIPTQRKVIGVELAGE